MVYLEVQEHPLCRHKLRAAPGMEGSRHKRGRTEVCCWVGRCRSGQYSIPSTGTLISKWGSVTISKVENPFEHLQKLHCQLADRAWEAWSFNRGLSRYHTMRIRWGTEHLGEYLGCCGQTNGERNKLVMLTGMSTAKQIALRRRKYGDGQISIPNVHRGKKGGNHQPG